MTLESMLAALSPNEKLAVIDLLWQDLSKDPATFCSPDWHGEVLDSRLANPSTKPPLRLDAAIDDVKDRLNARRTQG